MAGEKMWFQGLEVIHSIRQQGNMRWPTKTVWLYKSYLDVDIDIIGKSKETESAQSGNDEQYDQLIKLGSLAAIVRLENLNSVNFVFYL